MVKSQRLLAPDAICTDGEKIYSWAIEYWGFGNEAKGKGHIHVNEKQQI